MVTWYKLKHPNDKGYVYFSISQGQNQVGIKNVWYEIVKHLLNFVESAAALNESHI